MVSKMVLINILYGCLDTPYSPGLGIVVRHELQPVLSGTVGGGISLKSPASSAAAVCSQQDVLAGHISGRGTPLL